MATGVKKFVLSTSSVNSYGFRILTEGADLTQFKKNPVMLFNHQRSEGYNGPVGKWNNITINGDEISAESQFDLSDANATALAAKVDGGFINATSLGIKVIETSDDPALMLPGQILPTVTKWKAIEASICDIPSNDDSLVLFDNKHKAVELTQQGLVNLFAPLNKQNQTTYMDMETVALAFGLPPNAPQHDVVKAIDLALSDNKSLTAANEELQAQNTTLQTALAASTAIANTAYIDLCIAQKKITAGEREAYISLMTSDAVNTKKLLDAKTAPMNLAQHLAGMHTNTTANEDRTQWKFEDYRRKDPQALALMRIAEPEKFTKLCAEA